MQIECPNCREICESENEPAVGQHLVCPYCEQKFSYVREASNFEHTNETHDELVPDGVESGQHNHVEDDCESLLMASMPEKIHKRIPLVTVALIVACVTTGIVVACSAGSLEPDAKSLVAYGADFRPLTFGGQFWRLLSSSFLHFDLKHLLLNMLCLFSLGRFLERLIGHVNLLCVYVLSAVAGGLASMLVHVDSVSAGASGAVFGLFGAEIVYVLCVRAKYGLKREHVASYMASGLAWIGINFLYGFFPGVDMAGHVGGLFSGLVLGAVMALPAKGCDGGDAAPSRIVIGFSILVALILSTSLVTGKDAGRLSVTELTTQISLMLNEKLNENVGDGGSFEVANLGLIHDGGRRYHGTVEMAFKCGGKMWPLKSRIEVVHDALETAYELNKDDFEKELAGLQKALQHVSIDDLTAEVSRMLTENMTKRLMDEGCKNVSVKVTSLSLAHDGGDRYHGNVEMVCRYDGEYESFTLRIDIKYDGENIMYELKE